MADQQSPDLKPIIIQLIGKIDEDGHYCLQVVDKESGRKITNIAAIEFPVITARHDIHPPQVKLTFYIRDFHMDAVAAPGHDLYFKAPVTNADFWEVCTDQYPPGRED